VTCLAAADNSLGCRKGNRECSYPEPSALTKTRRSSPQGKPSQDDSTSPESTGHNDLDEDTPLSSTSGPLDSPDLESPSKFFDSKSFQKSVTSTPVQLSQEAFPRRSETTTTRNRSLSVRFTDLAPELQSLLHFAKQFLTSYHYNLPIDGIDGTKFVQTVILENALRFEPLMYAVACFAAFHRAFRRPDGDVKDFLGWHTKSIKALHDSLKRGQRHTYLTILTILQLATIEVCPEAICNEI
jgi:hypothetical protein